MIPHKRNQKESIDQKLKGRIKEEEVEEVEGEEIEEEEVPTKKKKMEMMKVSSKFKRKVRIKEEVEVEEVDKEETIEAIEEEKEEAIEEEIEVVLKEDKTEGADLRLQTKKNLRLKKTTLNEIFECIYEIRKLMYLYCYIDLKLYQSLKYLH